MGSTLNSRCYQHLKVIDFGFPITLLSNHYQLLYEKKTWDSPTNLGLQVDLQQMPQNHQKQLGVVKY